MKTLTFRGIDRAFDFLFCLKYFFQFPVRFPYSCMVNNTANFIFLSSIAASGFQGPRSNPVLRLLSLYPCMFVLFLHGFPPGFLVFSHLPLKAVSV